MVETRKSNMKFTEHFYAKESYEYFDEPNDTYYEIQKIYDGSVTIDKYVGEDDLIDIELEYDYKYYPPERGTREDPPSPAEFENLQFSKEDSDKIPAEWEDSLLEEILDWLHENHEEDEPPHDY